MPSEQINVDLSHFAILQIFIVNKLLLLLLRFLHCPFICFMLYVRIFSHYLLIRHTFHFNGNA